MQKRALILGITGQDGSYLAELLLAKGYKVYGMYRRSSTGNLKNIQGILDKVTLVEGDLADPLSIQRAFDAAAPDEVYNEADQDNVGWSYKTPSYSYDITGAAVGRILEIIRIDWPDVRFFQPVSATIFGNTTAPQNEGTPLNPQSPYACAKAMAYHLVRYYRETQGLFACTAILYNHDSPRRSEEYLLNKICRSAIRVASKEQGMILLGNLDTRVDIGYAPEYVEVLHKILQLPTAEDFVIATEIPCKIGELARYALEEVGVDPKGKIGTDPKYYRADSQFELLGNTRKARHILGFDPVFSGRKLVQVMIKQLMQVEQCIHTGEPTV